MSSQSSLDSMPSLPVRVLSSIRVFPVNRLAAASPTTVALSIADNKCDGFGFTAAVWLFDADRNSNWDGQLLLRSLEATLSLFPWWCGSLSRCPVADSTVDSTAVRDLPPHCLRFGRLLLTYGVDSDPGVAMVVAECPLQLKNVVPSPSDLALKGAWHSQPLLSADLCKSTPLLMQEGPTNNGFSDPPCMMVQLTTFDGGGHAIAVRIAHALADVPSIATFIQRWSQEHRTLVIGHDPHISDLFCPLFDPQLLDREAVGDIDASQPEASLLEIALRLPLERWDRWASTVGCPHVLADQHVVPPGVKHLEPFGVAIQWSDWDPTVPCDYYVLHFAADELHRMRLEASTPLFRPSTLLALSTHLWRTICDARGLTGDGGTAQFVCNIGLRSRLPSPLPPTFIGSPVLEVTTTLPVSIVCSGQSADIASAIQRTISTFNATTVPALLHSFAFEDHPTRWCHGMWGRRHVALTSWQHSGLQNVQFVPGHTPRYVDAIFDDSTDGFFTVMEAVQGQGDLLVQLHLECRAMNRFIVNPNLRRFRKPAPVQQ